MIGKTNSKQGAPAAQEIVNIRLISNQTEHSDLVGTKFTLSYETFKKEYTWSGNEVTAQIPAHVTYSVEFGDAEGYNTPEKVSYMAIEDNARTIEAAYTCELLTVNVSADEGTPEGFEITIRKAGQGGLSSEYTFLEYIESTTRSAYIDTGFIPGSTTRVLMDAEVPDSSSLVCVMGVNDWTSGKYFQIRCTTSGTTYVSDFGSNANKATNVKAEGRLIFDKNGNKCTIGSTTVTNTSSTFTCNSNLKLLAGVNTSGSHSASIGKIYSCKIWNNGTLVRNYLPAKSANGEVGLYDTVNDVLYTSASTTEFVAGPEIASPFIPIEYIQSDGTEYINTGFKPNNNTRVVLDTELVETPTANSWILGSRTSSSSKNYAVVYMYSSKVLRSDYNSTYNQNFTIPTGRFLIDKNKEKTTIGSETKSYTNSSFQGDYELYLFASNNAGSVSNTTSLKIYSCQIYDNDVLVRDFIPVMNYIYECGLYDRVNGRYYASCLEGVLIGGDEITVVGETIAVQTTSTGSYKIPFGTEYIINASNISGFETPNSITRTASQVSYTANMEYKKVTTIDLSLQDVYGNPINRSTANCYVISKPGQYKFPLVYGNAIKNGQVNTAAFTNNGGTYSHDFVDYNGTVVTSPYIETVSGTASSAQLSIADTDGIFTDISIIDGSPCRYLQFKVNSVPATGANGVLSIKNSSGVIMWSWHIWVWEDDLSPVEITNSTSVKYNILPVNLASKWDNDSKTHIKNWYYQFGRPTPLSPASTYNSTINAITYGTLSFIITNTASTLNLGILNPTTLYSQDEDYGYNWYLTNYSKTYNLWDAACTSRGASDNNVVKTIYDPCPIGFKMPNGNTFTYFSTSNVVGSFANGWKFKRYSGDTVGVFFPALSRRHPSGGGLSDIGSKGYVWSTSAYSDRSKYCLEFGDSYVYPLSGYYCANGFSVRPVQE